MATSLMCLALSCLGATELQQGIDAGVTAKTPGKLIPFIYSMAFSPDSKQLLAGGVGRLELWDVAAKKKIASSPENLDVSCVDFLGTDRYVIGTIVGRFNPKKLGEPLEYGKILILDRQFRVKDTLPGDCVFINAGKGIFYTAKGGADGNGAVLEVKKESQILTDELVGNVCSLILYGDMLAIGATSPNIRLLNLKTKQISEPKADGNGSAMGMLGDKLVFLGWGREGPVYVCPIHNPDDLKQFPAKGQCLGTNGKDLIVIGTMDGALEGYTINGKKSFRMDGVHKLPVVAVAISPDGKWIASSGYDGKVVFSKAD